MLPVTIGADTSSSTEYNMVGFPLFLLLYAMVVPSEMKDSSSFLFSFCW